MVSLDGYIIRYKLPVSAPTCAPHKTLDKCKRSCKKQGLVGALVAGTKGCTLCKCSKK